MNLELLGNSVFYTSIYLFLFYHKLHVSSLSHRLDDKQIFIFTLMILKYISL